MNKEIQIDPHTLLRAEERGASKEEIIDVIKTGTEFEAKKGRLGKYKIFLFQKIRNGKIYEQKKIEVIYIPEENKIITVTVYVFYGKWESRCR